MQDSRVISLSGDKLVTNIGVQLLKPLGLSAALFLFSLVKKFILDIAGATHVIANPEFIICLFK